MASIHLEFFCFFTMTLDLLSGLADSELWRWNPITNNGSFRWFQIKHSDSSARFPLNYSEEPPQNKITKTRHRISNQSISFLDSLLFLQFFYASVLFLCSFYLKKQESRHSEKKQIFPFERQFMVQWIFWFLLICRHT